MSSKDQPLHGAGGRPLRSPDVRRCTVQDATWQAAGASDTRVASMPCLHGSPHTSAVNHNVNGIHTSVCAREMMDMGSRTLLGQLLLQNIPSNFGPVIATHGIHDHTEVKFSETSHIQRPIPSGISTISHIPQQQYTGVTDNTKKDFVCTTGINGRMSLQAKHTARMLRCVSIPNTLHSSFRMRITQRHRKATTSHAACGSITSTCTVAVSDALLPM